MNLRKDHSHAIQNTWCTSRCELLFRDEDYIAAPEELARRWQRLRWVCWTHSAQPLPPHTRFFFFLTHVLSGFLEGLAPLVAYAYYTFQRWMSGLERR